jgi:hypothetical protein
MMTDTQLKMLFWMLLVITPLQSAAGTEIAGIGSQQITGESGPELAASNRTAGLPQNSQSEPATLNANDAEEEECD